MAEEGTGGRGRGEKGGQRKGPEREGEGRKREGPMTLWHGAPQCLNPALQSVCPQHTRPSTWSVDYAMPRMTCAANAVHGLQKADADSR